MKSQKRYLDNYSKILTQIDSLRSNVCHLLSKQDKQEDKNKNSCSVHINSSRTRTSSSLVKRSNSGKRTNRKNRETVKNQENKENLIYSLVTAQTQISHTNEISSIKHRLERVQNSQFKLKKENILLEERLRQERKKRKRIQQKLTEQKMQENNRHMQITPVTSEIYTPVKRGRPNLQNLGVRCTNKKQQGSLQSFLLGNWDKLGDHDYII